MNCANSTIVCALAALSMTLACKSAPTRGAQGPSTGDPLWANSSESVLYARDGSVVQGGSSASSTSDEPRHDVTARDGSRMYLLELYQKTVQEKEGLTREVQSLHEAVVRAGETQRALEKERDDARAVVARLEKELEQSRGENVDLAARLVTAQIRRLEAEKLVLEARIDSLRRGSNSGPGAAAEAAGPVGATKPEEAALEGRP